MGMPESSLMALNCATDGLPTPDVQFEIVDASTPKYSAISHCFIPVLTSAAFKLILSFSNASHHLSALLFSTDAIIIHLNSIVNTKVQLNLN